VPRLSRFGRFRRVGGLAIFITSICCISSATDCARRWTYGVTGEPTHSRSARPGRRGRAGCRGSRRSRGWPCLRRLSQGCSFAPRCARRMAECRIIPPQPVSRAWPHGRVSCSGGLHSGSPGHEDADHVGAEGRSLRLVNLASALLPTAAGVMHKFSGIKRRQSRWQLPRHSITATTVLAKNGLLPGALVRSALDTCRQPPASSAPGSATSLWEQRRLSNQTATRFPAQPGVDA
jgi:hypothetical protein